MAGFLNRASQRLKGGNKRDSLKQDIIQAGWIVRDGTAIGTSAARRYCALTATALLVAHDDQLEHMAKHWTLHRYAYKPGHPTLLSLLCNPGRCSGY